MAALKPNKPSTFDGKRDFFSVNSWLHKVNEYLLLVQIGNQQQELPDNVKISYAASFFTDTAASWWYIKVASNQVPETYQQFEELVRSEFIPSDSVKRNRDRIKRVKQKGSVAAYVTEFRNVMMKIPDMTVGEKIDRFCEGLKDHVRLEVMKSGTENFEVAVKIAMDVDNAYYRAGMFQNSGSSGAAGSSGIGPTPMDIGNVIGQNKSRMDDMKNNACFKCHTVGCRPWKHNDINKDKKQGRVNNFSVEELFEQFSQWAEKKEN